MVSGGVGGAGDPDFGVLDGLKGLTGLLKISRCNLENRALRFRGVRAFLKSGSFRVSQWPRSLATVDGLKLPNPFVIASGASGDKFECH